MKLYRSTPRTRLEVGRPKAGNAHPVAACPGCQNAVQTNGVGRTAPLRETPSMLSRPAASPRSQRRGGGPGQLTLRPSGERAAPAQRGAIPEALRQASVRRSSARVISVLPPQGFASSRSHALVDARFRLSVREPEGEIVRWGPGRAWGAFLANGSIAATGRAAPGRRPPRIS